MRTTVGAMALVCVIPLFGHEPVDLRTQAFRIAGAERTAEAKVRAIVEWSNGNLKWNATDYKKRSAEEVVAQGGGNCNEQALVVVAMLKHLGVETRRVREINIQPEKESRQKSAEAQIAKNGSRSSVFGRGHNDHVWIEFYEPAQDRWVPADPTLNLVGVEEWVRARVGFEGRKTHAILPSRDMIVPFAVLAMVDGCLEDRTARYLIEGLNQTYGGSLRSLPSWSRWSELIRSIAPRAKAAFEGTENLHEQASLIEAVESAYQSLSAEYAQRNRGQASQSRDSKTTGLQ